MRTIGLDLAVQTAHKAVVLDEHGPFCTPILTVHTRPSELSQLLERAREGAPSTEVQLVMEPTGMAWFPIAVYYARQALPIYLVNSQEVADLRRYYQRHAKSDRIDTRVLARLPLVNPAAFSFVSGSVWMTTSRFAAKNTFARKDPRRRSSSTAGRTPF